MQFSKKLYQATMAALSFACCWLLYFMLLASNLPMLLKFFHSVDLEGGWAVCCCRYRRERSLACLEDIRAPFC